MNQSDNTQKALLDEIDRQLIVSSVLAIIVLVISFFVISNTQPVDGSFLESAKSLALGLIVNIIPVGLLFVGSYFLYRKIQQIKESNQISDISRKVSEDVRSTVHASVSNAFKENSAQTEIVQKDVSKLGINRIFGHLDDVQKEVPMNVLIDGAQTVYFLGTSLSITALRDRFIRENTETDFRFIFVTLADGYRTELRDALAIIHNSAMSSKLQETEMAFSRIASKFSNVHHKSIAFVPPFSAILALGKNHDGKEWGRLQIDSLSS